MQLTNTLTKETQDLLEESLITLKENSNNFIISIPHSGQLIPSSLIPKFNLTKSLLIGTDLYTNQIGNLNKGLILSTFLSSSFVNMSRYKEPNPNPSLPLSAQEPCYKVNSLTDEPIQTQPYSQEEINLALKYYNIYHQKLKEAITKIPLPVIILDIHSMSSQALKNTPDYNKNQERPDFNIGTLNNTSASKEIIEKFTTNLKKHSEGFTIQSNFPYKGGIITRLYGQPSKSIHCIQLEIKKSLFMDESLKKGNFIFYPEKAKKIKEILENTMNSLTSPSP